MAAGMQRQSLLGAGPLQHTCRKCLRRHAEKQHMHANMQCSHASCTWQKLVNNHNRCLTCWVAVPKEKLVNRCNLQKSKCCNRLQSKYRDQPEWTLATEWPTVTAPHCRHDKVHHHTPCAVMLIGLDEPCPCQGAVPITYSICTFDTCSRPRALGDRAHMCLRIHQIKSTAPA
jgi:hypothetical protein